MDCCGRDMELLSETDNEYQPGIINRTWKCGVCGCVCFSTGEAHVPEGAHNTHTIEPPTTNNNGRG